MKKIILILILTLSSIHSENLSSEINEYKVDLYYANGIMMMESEGAALEKWQDQVDELVLFSHPELQRFIGKKGIAYNISHGVVADMWESFNQATDVDPRFGVGWKAFMLAASSVKYIGKAIDWLEKIQGYASNMI